MVYFLDRLHPRGRCAGPQYLLSEPIPSNGRMNNGRRTTLRSQELRTDTSRHPAHRAHPNTPLALLSALRGYTIPSTIDEVSK